MNLRFIDWIWHVRGSLALAPGQSSRDAFDKLDHLFQVTGTSHQRTNDTLTFTKKDQAAQDKMSVFDGGVLHVEKDAAGSMLRYDLKSRALLFCFLAPLLFIGFGQVITQINKHEKPPAHDAAKKPAVMPMNPVDKALGAPAPDKNPKKDDAGGGGKKGGKLTSTPAYVFAVFFVILYLVGRILESWLIKRVFTKSLFETDEVSLVEVTQ